MIFVKKTTVQLIFNTLISLKRGFIFLIETESQFIKIIFRLPFALRIR